MLSILLSGSPAAIPTNSPVLKTDTFEHGIAVSLSNRILPNVTTHLNASGNSVEWY